MNKKTTYDFSEGGALPDSLGKYETDDKPKPYQTLKEAEAYYETLDKPKLCKDCEYYDEYQGDANTTPFTHRDCNRPIEGAINLIDGSQLNTRSDADNERLNGDCGPEAKHFKQKKSFWGWLQFWRCKNTWCCKCYPNPNQQRRRLRCVTMK